MTIFCLLFSLQLVGQEHTDRKFVIPDSPELMRERALVAETQMREDDLTNLRQAKLALMAGDTGLADRYLQRLSALDKKLAAVVARYKALSAFVQDDFQSAYDLVKNDRFNIVSSYEEICVLRLLSLFALGNKNEAYRKLNHEYSNCRSLTEQYSKNNQLWLTSMKLLSEGNVSRLPGNKLTDFTTILENTDTTKLWLKLAIYSNREEFVTKNIALLPEEAYRNIGIRELLGMAYYRHGDVKRANDFIEDLSSPNADNIRGDIALTKKEWEIAYGHFRLALKRKEDSLNALERAIPLSWILEQWQDGLELLSRYVGPNYDQAKLLALETALRIRLNQYDRADKNLRILTQEFGTSAPLEIKLMKSFVATMRNDLPLLKESATQACRSFDGLNCWLSDQLLVWDDFSKTIKRTDEVNIVAESPDQILAAARVPAQALKEKVLIDQRDIEELDSSLVNLELP